MRHGAVIDPGSLQAMFLGQITCILNCVGWETCISILTNTYSHSLEIFDGNGLFSVQLVIYIQKRFIEGGSNHITAHVEPRGSRTVLMS